MSTKKFQEGRIPTPSGHVVVGEGQHQNHRRLSEPAPPRHHTPPPRTAGRTESPRLVLPASQRHLAAVSDTPHLKCPKCRTSRPHDSFVLLTQSERTFGAVRRWCDECLRGSAFSKHKVVKSRLAAMIRAREAGAAEAAAHARDEAARARTAAAVNHALTSNTVALSLYDRAAADPTFAAALRLATSALDFERADLEAVM